jgi:hypothetical protein
MDRLITMEEMVPNSAWLTYVSGVPGRYVVTKHRDDVIGFHIEGEWTAFWGGEKLSTVTLLMANAPEQLKNVRRPWNFDVERDYPVGSEWSCQLTHGWPAKAVIQTYQDTRVEIKLTVWALDSQTGFYDEGRTTIGGIPYASLGNVLSEWRSDMEPAPRNT